MYSVLVVEDYTPLLMLYREVLGKEYECRAVGSAEQALEALAEAEFDVVVTDIALPGMSGTELLKLLRKNRPETPVIIISGAIRPRPSDIVSEVGAYVFVLNAPLATRPAESAYGLSKLVADAPELVQNLTG